MKISISQAKEQSINFLSKLGMKSEEAALAAKNIIDAEVAGKPGHGLVRLKYIQKLIKEGRLMPDGKDPFIIKDDRNVLHIDGSEKIGTYVIEKYLGQAIDKAKQSGILVFAAKTKIYTGYIGEFARTAAQADLIYIGMNNSEGGLIPFGSIKDMWGTNPVTVGIPSLNDPVVADFASSKLTYGAVLEAKSKGEQLPPESILDGAGKPSTTPEAAWDGGLLPIGGHKGSALAMAVELIAGGLTNSRVGYNHGSGWGSFAILIDPDLLLPLDEFKASVVSAIQELKSAPKVEGVTEIFYPGERSQRIRSQNLAADEIEVNNNLWQEINS